MIQENRWLLPAGIDELLPDAAWVTEALRRRVLDHLRAWGYELVIPPMVEFVESLLIHPGDDLDLATFKLIDQLTGRLMGIRADMTPQMARIDAHSLGRSEPTRLCYLGTVLHAVPDGFAGSRAPLQVGAELFGHAGIASDREILGLMLDTLNVAGVGEVWLDLGHVGVFRALVAQAQFDQDDEAQFFDLLQRKAIPELRDFLAARQLESGLSAMLHVLPGLHGEGLETLERARIALAGAGDTVAQALDDLAELAHSVAGQGVHLHLDLAELRGYHYHTGMVFAAYVPGHRQAIARGGRYDGIGEAFGRARPATGFSADMRALIDLTRFDTAQPKSVAEQSILAPVLERDEQGYAELKALVSELRAQGKRVIQALPDDNEPDEHGGDHAQTMGCTHRIEPDMTHESEFWTIKETLI